VAAARRRFVDPETAFFSVAAEPARTETGTVKQRTAMVFAITTIVRGRMMII
jgi:hypothetical protein